HRGAGMEGMEGGMPPMGMQEGRGMEGGMQHGQEMGQAPGGMGGGGGIGRGSSAGSSLQWVPCTITYDGRDWYKVGMRFKGNSSLMKTAREGSKKLSIKLDFDQYENEYPELKNQRFYGFKQLNLSNNCNDASLLREKITTDLYREFGIVAAHTSHYELYVDYGEGAQLFGVYTLVEEVDDSVIGNAFSDDSGNLYKPEERAGSFAEGTFNEEQFYLKTNKKKADYSDVRALYDIINSEERTTNQKAWKKKLEKVFDVDVFLKWLAANTAVQNWDTYGHMAHNYFLYTNPKTGKITWISWDHNEALQGGMRAYEAGQLSSVAATWPLISYIITVDEYKAKFDKYLKEFTENIFYPSKMIATYEDYYNLLKDYADKSDIGTSFSRNGLQFDQAIEQLKLHVVSRRTAITDYLESK
ncbi:MAG: CotH kinase family protein, partial [Rikenellaceae bacterium]